MGNAKRRILSNVMLMSMLAGASAYSIGTHEHHEPTRCKSVDEIAGYEHKVRTEEEKTRKKKHKKKLKARRNAKKGVYANKIKYPKKREVIELL